MTRLEDVAIWVQPATDNVAVAKAAIARGTVVVADEQRICVTADIKMGHRFAVKAIPAGEWARQYGQPFGVSRGIGAGEPITAENLENRIPHLDAQTLPVGNYADLSGLRITPTPTFQGYRRTDGRAGTRNWVLVVPTSMCASHEASTISLLAEANGVWSRDKYPNVDGVSAIPHTQGCGCPDGGAVVSTVKMLSRYLNHPNVAAALIVELGCEKTNLAIFQNFALRYLEQLEEMSGSEVVRLTSAPPRPASRIFGKPVRTVSIQEAGGTEATIQRGLELLPELLAEANKCRREAVPVSELSLGLKCGGSDAFSGLSANPALGHASDILIANGGTSIITEVPEFVGAEHLYAGRCRSRDGARQVFEAMKRYRDYLLRAGHGMDENPSPGNKEGGLINITIKSLGSLAKSGTGPVEGVIDYGEPPPHRGHWMLYCPSYDQSSTAALVASGCQVIAFTTGRGTGIGNAIAPVMKIASNSEMAARLKGDIDLDAGTIIAGTADIESVGRQLFDLTLATAGGRWCRAEHTKHREFMIWDEEGVSL